MNLRWLYKIHSNYDGFRPVVIPDRMLDGDLLHLGWKRYLDEVEIGAEVWIYFHGRHRFDNGVYVKGIIREVDRDGESVLLRVREYSTTKPLTDSATSARVAAVVARRYRQVFVFPTELEPIPACDLATVASTCAGRLCGACPTWKSLPRIRSGDVKVPERVGSAVRAVVSAYWVIPSRCYLHWERKTIQAGVRRTSEQFYRFKVGEEQLAFPLALGMFEALRKRRLLDHDFDAVVPIPLSPEKERRGEIHRTRTLAHELAHLLGIKVAELLSLSRSISKRTLGLPARDFENRYRRALDVSSRVADYRRILLLDDVATRGSTINVAAEAMMELNPSLVVVAITAGRMIIKSSMRNESAIIT